MTRLYKLVTGDEKWGMYLNTVQRATWVDAEATAPDIPKGDIHGRRVRLSVWWSVHGVEYWELLAQGTIITAVVYSRQLQDLKAHLASSREKLAFIHFQHDYARPPASKLTKTQLTGFGWHVLPYPAYSPNLAPSDYWLFSEPQHYLDGQDFKNEAEVKHALTAFFASKAAT